MKIGTITFHFASNQGAVLQCYALQRYLENLGHEVSVIRYEPRYHTIRYAKVKNPFLYAKNFWKKFYYRPIHRRIVLTIRSFLRCIYLNAKQNDSKIEECYDIFRSSHLHLTKEYKTLRQLKKNPPTFDAYISGSDQLWNPEVLDQSLDPAYFLQFGSNKTIRISYAVSIGKEMPERDLKNLKDLCQGINAISIREYNKDVVEAIERCVHICIDPTFLLDAKDYQDVESSLRLETPYIFVYGFESNDDIFTAIEVAKKKYNCAVINGSPVRVKYQGDAENVWEYGPDSFLSYIKYAQCVVTNSFHATAFSIIYRKRFITVPHSTRGMRMKDLLGKLGLTSCLYGDKDYSIDAEIDYEKVYELLNKWRANSEEFLALALQGKSGEEIPLRSDLHQYGTDRSI